MKYFVLGSLASGMLLYGLSLIYGATGSLDIATIHQAAAAPGQHTLMLTGLAFVLVGLAFKFGAAPFHMRSEEHTSELQSLMRISYAVFCLKKKIKTLHHTHIKKTI